MRYVPCDRDDPDAIKAETDEGMPIVVKAVDLPYGQSAKAYVPPRELANKPAGTWLRNMR